jgi:hypothetical protein
VPLQVFILLGDVAFRDMRIQLAFSAYMFDLYIIFWDAARHLRDAPYLMVLIRLFFSSSRSVSSLSFILLTRPYTPFYPLHINLLTLRLFPSSHLAIIAYTFR